MTNLRCLFHRADETAKASTYLHETLVDPKTAFSGDAKQCAVSKAFNAELSLWEILELPENVHRLKRFGLAMEGSSRIESVESLLESKFGTDPPMVCNALLSV